MPLLENGDRSTVLSRHHRSVVHTLIQQETLAIKRQLFAHGQKKVIYNSNSLTPPLAMFHLYPRSLYHIEDRRNFYAYDDAGPFKGYRCAIPIQRFLCLWFHM
ncbi:hypothetical protein COCOBI_pt-1220 (chloroplast) [Coccomyxa sp. Obi]|nr:hypothetical protein COCOBI_pt-1220 [Coccomyxa sp. Obi]